MRVKSDLPRERIPVICLIFLGLLIASTHLSAEEIAVDPGDVVAPPTGTSIAALYLQNTKSNKLYSDGNLITNQADLKTTVGLLRLGHVMEVAGFKVLPQVILPYGHMDLGKDLGAQPAMRTTVFGDTLIGATAWLVSDPESKTWFGIPFYLSLPTGEYDGNQGPFNIAENRWKATLQAGYAKGLSDKFLVEVIGEYSMYGKNDDFYGKSMEQKASQSLMGHLTYKATAKTSLSMSYFHTIGGETKVDGFNQSDRKNNSRWLATASTWVAPGLNVQLQYGQDLDVKNGLKQSDRINLRLAKLF